MGGNAILTWTCLFWDGNSRIKLASCLISHIEKWKSGALMNNSSTKMHFTVQCCDSSYGRHLQKDLFYSRLLWSVTLDDGNMRCFNKDRFFEDRMPWKPTLFLGDQILRSENPPSEMWRDKTTNILVMLAWDICCVAYQHVFSSSLAYDTYIKHA